MKKRIFKLNEEVTFLGKVNEIVLGNVEVVLREREGYIKEFLGGGDKGLFLIVVDECGDEYCVPEKLIKDTPIYPTQQLYISLTGNKDFSNQSFKEFLYRSPNYQPEFLELDSTTTTLLPAKTVSCPKESITLRVYLKNENIDNVIGISEFSGEIIGTIGEDKVVVVLGEPVDNTAPGKKSKKLFDQVSVDRIREKIVCVDRTQILS